MVRASPPHRTWCSHTSRTHACAHVTHMPVSSPRPEPGPRVSWTSVGLPWFPRNEPFPGDLGHLYYTSMQILFVSLSPGLCFF